MKLMTFIMAVSFFVATTSIGYSQVPDLTEGEVPTDSATINLGATGLRGWLYYTGKADTSLSRQILLTEVDAGSPADGILAVDDVILGANGSGGTAVSFSTDARVSLALAITNAEARSPGTLDLLLWRAGVTSNVQITLRTMGAYTSTAPYNCAKSTKILEEVAVAVSSNGDFGLYSFGLMGLLATGDASYTTQIQSAAQALVLSESARDELMKEEADTDSNVTWPRGHRLILLAEYYLATGDSSVLSTIEAYAVNIANNQSLFGTLGHKYAERNADGSNGSMGGVYGVVNSAGLPCFYGLLLARKCGVTHAVIEPAIERTSMFFSYYVNKGAIPYGEHQPYSIYHESNGKSGLAALAFSMEEDRSAEGRFFTKMAVAASEEREIGHTGSFFNYLWAPLGANVGGEVAAAAHFSRISWHLDLARNWDGSFDYDCLNGEGPDSGSSYNNFQMNTAALLLYAMPQRELYLTGKDQDSSRWLTSSEIDSAVRAGSYDGSVNTLADLKADLGHWSPRVQTLAADEIYSEHTMTSALRSEINALATDNNGTSRDGACRLLGLIADSEAGDTLVDLLTDAENNVRFLAAEGMRYLSDEDKSKHLNTILSAVASTSQPLLPFVEEDPMQMAHGRLCMLLFNDVTVHGPRGVLYSGFDGVDRDLLYPAIRAAATTPVGLCTKGVGRAFQLLEEADVMELSGTIIDAAQNRAAADKMFTQSIRTGALQTLLDYNIAEGVPLSVIVAENDGRASVRKTCMGILEDYAAAVNNVSPDAGALAWLEEFAAGGDTNAQAAIDAINGDTNPISLLELKTLDSFDVSDTDVILPSNSSLLLAGASDIANGDLIYTWKQLSGPDVASITAKDDFYILEVADEPGSYELELTVSDSRGLTELTGLVTVAFTAPALDVTAPSPNPMGFELAPVALDGNTVTMTATTASDYSGPVEYLFNNQTLGSSSGWQTSPTWSETGLIEGASYQYAVRARDAAPSPNYTNWSSSLDITLVTDSTAPVISGNAWAAAPSGSSATSITMTAAEVSDINGVEYYFTNLNFPDGSHDSGWQDSATYTDTGLPSGQSYSYSVSVRDKSTNVNQSSESESVTAFTGFPSQVLFADTFNRSSSTELNGSTDGKTGGLGILSYKGRTFNDVLMGIDDNAFRINGPTADGSYGGLIYIEDHNFSDTSLVSGGGFSISVDIAAYSTIGSNRQMSVGVGQSLAELSDQTGVAPLDHQSDLLVCYRDTTDDLEIYKNGVLDSSETVLSGLPNDPTTMRIDYAVSDFNQGSTVTYKVYFASSSTPFTTGSFTWSGTNENYISIAANLTGDARFDNLEITGDLGVTALQPMAWASYPSGVSETSISMTAVSAGQLGRVEYYFANTSFSNGSHDSGWQDSASYTDTGLSAETSYNYTVIARDKLLNANEAAVSETVTGSTNGAIGFADTFNRTNSDDLNASDGGKTGILGALNYSSRVFNAVSINVDSEALCIEGLSSSGSYGGLVYINDHNFVDPSLAVAGEFSVSVDIANYSTVGSGRRMCVGVGQSLSELDSQIGVAATEHVADLLVAYRDTTDDLEIYKNGVLDSSETVLSGLPNDPTTMRIDYALSDFNEGSTVTYGVFFDGSVTPFTTGSFTWSGTDENYISLSSNLTNDARFDNLKITGDFVLPLDLDQAQWASLPTSASSTSITMSALVQDGFDPARMEYYFTNTTVTDGSHDSGWQSSSSFTDTGLTLALINTYSYTVIVRDKLQPGSSGSLASDPASITPDTTAPEPNPMGWSVQPIEISNTSVAMRAITASDLNGVEYYFTNMTVTDGSHDSGWQDSAVYTDDGLTPGVNYTYTVVARDRSPAQNVTSTSPAIAVTNTTPNSSGLQAMWAMEDGSGTNVSDSFTSNFDGTAVNTSWVDGEDGKALEFNGTDSRVDLPAAAFSSIDKEISITMWVYGDTTQPRADSVFYASNVFGDRVLNIHLPWSNSNVYWDAGGTAGYDRINKVANPSEFKGKWNHWAFTKNTATGEMSIYLNGALWHQGFNNVKTMSGITVATLGGRISSMSYDGMMSNVRLYNVELTATEISSIFAIDNPSNLEDWLSKYSGLPDTDFNGDPDNDGVETGLEYVLNGDPTSVGGVTLPKVVAKDGGFVFSFERRASSTSDTTQILQYGSTLKSDEWVDVDIDSSSSTEVTLGDAENNMQSVGVMIDHEKALGGKLFFRLKVEKKP